MWDEKESPGHRVIVSYRTLRRVVGALGMLLPVLVVIEYWIESHSWIIRPSISDYYNVQARDLFVGILFTIGWFLFTYRGHDRRDDIAGDAACLFALGTALISHDAPGGLSTFHFIFATALFLTLAYFSMHLFTQTGGAESAMTPMKRRRNGLYLTCGWIMLGSIFFMGIYKVFGMTWSFGPVPVIFAGEMLALEAFGVSWMVKGETVWRD